MATFLQKHKKAFFFFSFTLEGRLKKFFQNKVFSLTDEQTDILKNLILFAKKESERFDISVSKYPYHAFLMPDEFSDIYLQRLVLYISELFLSLVDHDNVSPSVYNHETQLFKTAVTFMSENISENISIEQVAKSCGTSLSGIKRIFAKYGGMGVHKYFLNLKLNAAIKLLKSGHTVTEVTDTLNFSSQSYFSSAFKRVTGKKPSDFKA